jgi:hypothetical protein
VTGEIDHSEINRAATDILRDAGHDLRALVADITRPDGERRTVWQARTTVEDRRLMVKINALATVLDSLSMTVDPMMDDL